MRLPVNVDRGILRRLPIPIPDASHKPFWSKHPPAEPVPFQLLVPQRGRFATVRSKSKNRTKNLVLLFSLPQHR